MSGEGLEVVGRVRANDFTRQWSHTAADVLAAVERVGRSGWWILGEEVRAFEDELAEWWGVEHAIGVASGLDALEIGLRCAGVGPGSRVLTTPLTAFATTLAILRTGARPVWVDVDETGGLDLTLADATLSADTEIDAILPVHRYGHPLDPIALGALSDRHGVAVVEDCAQSAGARRLGSPTGVTGVAAGTSLYPTKNLGAMGDGGVVLTGDARVADRARSLRDYGQSSRYVHDEVGLNSRLDELHAAILRSALLPHLDEWLARRAAVADRYVAGLAGSSCLRPIVPAAGQSSHHLFAVEVTAGDPDVVAAQLTEAGVGVGRHYPFLCPDQTAANGVGETIGALPVARRLAARELSLPMHPFLTDEEVERVIGACAELRAA